MKVLVTGGSGFVGARLVERLLAQGHQVRILDTAISQRFAALTVQGDIRCAQTCEQAVLGQDVICHLAALYRDDVRPRELYYQVNVDGTQRLADAAARHDVRHIVFTSSFSVYGLDDAGKSEEGVLAPVNDYGCSKLQAEAILRTWHAAAAGRTLQMLRPCVIFGEGNRGNVWTLMNQIAAGRFVMIGAGANHKSMAYVGNIAEYMAALVAVRDARLSVINYADKPDMTVREIVELAAGAIGRRVPRLPIPGRFALLLGYCGDVAGKLSGRVLTINSERIRKFLANTSLPTAGVDGSGFRRPFGLREAFVATMKFEFGQRRDAVRVDSTEQSSGGS